MYVCSCFGITESQVKQHAAEGACTPRQIASQCRAGTDCGGCVRRIQSLLGRGACPARLLEEVTDAAAEPEAVPSPVETAAPQHAALEAVALEAVALEAVALEAVALETVAPETVTRLPYAAQLT